MEEFDALVFDILNRYYTILEYKGYVKNSEVSKVILTMFIAKLLHSCAEYITEDDYKKIDNLITCMYGKSCLIPYTPHVQSTIPVFTYTLLLYSMSDSSKESMSLSSRLVSL